MPVTWLAVSKPVDTYRINFGIKIQKLIISLCANRFEHFDNSSSNDSLNSSLKNNEETWHYRLALRFLGLFK